MRMTRGRLLFALLVICLGLAGAGTLLLKAEPSGATRTVADLTFGLSKITEGGFKKVRIFQLMKHKLEVK